MVGGTQAADNYYFRLRPSVSILNQEPFSVHIIGDNAGIVGTTFNAKAEASSPRETLRFSVSDGNLPPGVTLDAASGSITGQPKLKGLFRATVTAEDAFSTASAPLEVQVYDSLEIESLISQYATVGVQYSSTFKGLGGNQDYNWSLAGTPPAGLSFSGASAQTSTIGGVPTTPGQWSDLRVNLSDSAGHSTSTAPFSVTVADPLKISGNPAAVATVGESYSAAFTSSGGHAPISWLLSSGALPKGLSFSNGTISGTPEEPGTSAGLVVQATDVASNKATSAPFSIAVSQPLSIAGTPPLFATIGKTYTASFTASGGSGGNVWKVASGTLPAGLMLDATGGKITGTPSVIGTSLNLVIRVTDKDGRIAESAPFSVTVSNDLTLIGAPSAIATVGTAYSATFSTSGGTGNNTWTVLAGTLPTGLRLSNGAITGTPTATGTWSNIVVRVTDSDGRTKDSAQFSITVSDPLIVAGDPATIATTGVGYSATFSASGGSGGKNWAIVSGSLPTGLSLSNATIVGTPSAAGTWSNIVIQVTDADGRIAQSGAFSIIVSDALKIYGGSPAIATVGQGYSGVFWSGGGGGGNSWAIVSGSLPSGLWFSNGSIGGTPSAAGTWSNIIVRVTDANGRAAQSDPFSIRVSNPISISGSTPWQGTVGWGYGGQFYVGGGNGNYGWGLASGPLPDGLWLNGNGTIGGSPSRSGVWNNIVIRVWDSDGRSIDSGAFSIYIYDQMSMGGNAGGGGKVGQYFQTSVAAYGGRGPYGWGIVAGGLPPGMGFSNGTVYGTPSSAGTWYFIIRAWDQDGRYVDSPTYAISVEPSIIREPASGEYYDNVTAWSDINIAGYGVVSWGGTQVAQLPLGSTVVGSGGATYYRGSSRGCTWIRGIPLACSYGVYRTIP